MGDSDPFLDSFAVRLPLAGRRLSFRRRVRWTRLRSRRRLRMRRCRRSWTALWFRLSPRRRRLRSRMLGPCRRLRMLRRSFYRLRPSGMLGRLRVSRLALCRSLGFVGRMRASLVRTRRRSLSRFWLSKDLNWNQVEEQDHHLLSQKRDKLRRRVLTRLARMRPTKPRLLQRASLLTRNRPSMPLGRSL